MNYPHVKSEMKLPIAQASHKEPGSKTDHHGASDDIQKNVNIKTEVPTVIVIFYRGTFSRFNNNTCLEPSDTMQ